MKLRPRTFKIQWNLHGWVGLVCAVPMFVMFYCGVFALFEDELEVWQDPMLWVEPNPDPGGPQSYATLQRLLAQELDVEKADRLDFVRLEDTPFVLSGIGEEPEQQRWIDPTSQRIEPRRSFMGHALNKLHFLGQLPGGTQIAGLFSVALMVLSLGGLLIFLKDIPKEIWTFRLHRAPKLWNADLHRMVGLWLLPFIVAIAWSGALLGLGGVFGAILADGDISRLQELRGYGTIQYTPTGEPAPTQSLSSMIETAQRSSKATELPHYAGVHLRGDENAWGFIFFESDMANPWRYVFLDAVSGDVNIDTSHEHSLSRGFEERLFGFHFAWFGGDGLRLIFCVLAWLVCVMIVAGQVIWVERPASQKHPRLVYLVGRLTVGACMGLVLASAGYFGLNRVLPPELSERAVTEWNGFLGLWLGLCLLSLWPRIRPLNLAGWYLALASAGFSAVIVYDRAVLVPNRFMPGSIRDVHLLMGTLILVCGSLAVLTWRRATAARVKIDSATDELG